MRILVVAEQHLADLVRHGLGNDGFRVETAAEYSLADSKVKLSRYEVILLHQRSLEVSDAPRLARWRRAGLDAFLVVVLPADSDGEERAAYLDAGADVCLLQPLSMEELKAHLRVLQRRTEQPRAAVRRIHDLEINPATRSAIRAGRSIHLTPREFDLLDFLARYPGKVLSRSKILQHLYEDDANNSSNIVDVYVGYLRNKIDRGFTTPLILTRWGEGYLLRPEGA